MRITIVALFLFTAIPIFGQQPEIFYKNYLVNDGLPSAQVYEIVEDHDGYIWFGTDAGIVRYNGYEFKTYTVKEGLSTNVIFKLFVDRNNRIWGMGKDWRINYFSEGRFYTLPDLLKFNSIDPKVWKDLLTFEIAGNRMHLNTAMNNFYGNTMENHFCATYEIDREGRVTESAKQPGIYIYDDAYGCRISMQSDSDMVVFYNGQLVDEKPLFKRKIRIDFANVIQWGEQLYFTADGKIFALSNASRTPKIHQVWSNELKIKDLKKDAANNIYIATKNGVCKFPNGDWTQEKWLFEGLSVSNILIDRNNGLWVGSLYKGVFYCFDQDVQCIYSPANVSINQIQGTQKGIYFINENSELFGVKGNTAYPIHRNKHSGLYYREMMRWYYAANCLLFKPHSGSQPVILNAETEESANILLYSRTHYRTDSTLVSNNRYRIEKINRAGEQIEISSFDQEIYKLGPLVDSFRIVATQAGVRKYVHRNRKPDNSVQHFIKVDSLEPYRADNSFFRSRISDILVLNDSTTIFSSTQNGCLIENKNGEDAYFTTEAGLISNSIHKLYANEGYVVFISREGITVVSDQYKIVNYNNKNGLLSKDVRNVFVRNDSIWAATDLGVSIFPLRELSGQNKQALHLTGIGANMRPLQATDGHLELKHWQRNLTLSFELIEYEQEGKINYSYMLEGLDQDWDTISNRTVRYLNLPAGSFNFWVKAQYADKNWSAPVCLLRIHKSLVIWKQSWFMALTGIVALGLLYVGVLLFYRRKNRVQKEKMNLLSLERKNLQAQMNPHFTYNTINSIQHYILNNDKKEAILYLSEFAKLMRKTLDFNYTEFISLQEELAFLKAYLDLENKRFNETFVLDIQADPALDISSIFIPSLLIQPLIENVIVHGNYSHGQKRTILLTITEDPKYYIIRVIDYGKGMQKNSNTKKHSSRGLGIVKSRIRIYNRKYFSDSDFISYFTNETDRLGNTTQMRLLKNENHYYR